MSEIRKALERIKEQCDKALLWPRGHLCDYYDTVMSCRDRANEALATLPPEGEPRGNGIGLYDAVLRAEIAGRALQYELKRAADITRSCLVTSDTVAAEPAPSSEKALSLEWLSERLGTETAGSIHAANGYDEECVRWRDIVALFASSPAPSSGPYSGDPATCECDYHKACREEPGAPAPKTFDEAIAETGGTGIAEFDHSSPAPEAPK